LALGSESVATIDEGDAATEPSIVMLPLFCLVLIRVRVRVRVGVRVRVRVNYSVLLSID
jgi:hypothetical protein